MEILSACGLWPHNSVYKNPTPSYRVLHLILSMIKFKPTCDLYQEAETPKNIISNHKTKVKGILQENSNSKCCLQ